MAAYIISPLETQTLHLAPPFPFRCNAVLYVPMGTIMASSIWSFHWRGTARTRLPSDEIDPAPSVFCGVVSLFLRALLSAPSISTMDPGKQSLCHGPTPRVLTQGGSRPPLLPLQTEGGGSRAIVPQVFRIFFFHFLHCTENWSQMNSVHFLNVSQGKRVLFCYFVANRPKLPNFTSFGKIWQFLGLFLVLHQFLLGHDFGLEKFCILNQILFESKVFFSIYCRLWIFTQETPYFQHTPKIAKKILDLCWENFEYRL